MDRNLENFNKFSNPSNITAGGLASNPRSESASNFVLLNDPNGTGYVQNQVTAQGLPSNQNRAPTSYGGGQFGLGQRLHELRRGGNTLVSFPEVREPLIITSNSLRVQNQPQPRGLVSVGGFTESSRNSLILRTEISIPSFTSPNILNRPVCQNHSVFVSNQVPPLNNCGCCCACRCSCHGHNTTAVPSYFLTPGQNSSHLQYPNGCHLQTPMKPVSTEPNPALRQRPVSLHQEIVFNADPIRAVQVQNNNVVNAVPSSAITPEANPLSMLAGKQKSDEQVQANQIQGPNIISVNDGVGDVNNVSAGGQPVETPVGDISSGNDNRYRCTRCRKGFKSSQDFSAHITAEHSHLLESAKKRRALINSRGRSRHPSEVITQVNTKPLFKQTSTSGLKIPTAELKKHIAEASSDQTNAEQSGANTASEGDPSQVVVGDDRKDVSGADDLLDIEKD